LSLSLCVFVRRFSYDAQDSVNIHQMGWQWMVVYHVTLLVTAHHVAFPGTPGSPTLRGLTLAKDGWQHALRPGFAHHSAELLFLVRRRTVRGWGLQLHDWRVAHRQRAGLAPPPLNDYRWNGANGGLRRAAGAGSR
jgi:hypothetical protein